jgi:hypothetical protein
VNSPERGNAARNAACAAPFPQLGPPAAVYTGLSPATPMKTNLIPLSGAPAGQHTGAGRHPAIRGAIMALERAKAEQQSASHDFGGHREDAPTACDNAIAQLKLALQYASQNNSSAPTPQPTP